MKKKQVKKTNESKIKKMILASKKKNVVDVKEIFSELVKDKVLKKIKLKEREIAKKFLKEK